MLSFTDPSGFRYADSEGNQEGSIKDSYNDSKFDEGKQKKQREKNKKDDEDVRNNQEDLKLPIEPQTEPHLLKDAKVLFTDPYKYAQCAAVCAEEVLGTGTAIKAGVVASGINAIPVAGKPGGATTGTSIASKFFRAIFGGARLPKRLPTPTLKNGISSKTIKVGTFVGRTVPFMGVVSLLPDARKLDYCTATCIRPGE